MTTRRRVRNLYVMPRKAGGPPKSLSGPEFKVERDRVDMKVPVDIRELLVDAATITYESLTGFILHSAVERAKRVIHDRARVERAEEALRRLPYVRY